MPARHWILVLGLFGALIGTTGCRAGGVVYVDEQGRELAVDDEGRPISLPPARGSFAATPTPATRTPPAWAPPVLDAPRTQASGLPVKGRDLPPTQRAPTALPARRTPVADPSWGLAPAASAGSGTLPAAAAPELPKKVDSSALLDVPPAG